METARPSLRENLRSLPPATWVLFGGTFVNRLGTFVMPFITLYLTQPEQGYSVPQAGLALALRIPELATIVGVMRELVRRRRPS